MSNSNGFTKTALIGTLALACGALYTAPASAQSVTRSFYQNAGANCHGINSINDAKLKRVSGRLQNMTTGSIDVICNLMTDAFTDTGTNGGVITGAYLWGRRNQIRGDNGSISCTLTTSYAGDSNGQTITLPLTLPGSGNGQGVVSYQPVLPARFLAPLNIRCVLPPLTELNDWLVTYSVPDSNPPV